MKWGECNKCGACCRAIALPGYEPGYFKNVTSKDPGSDISFIKENWIEIPQETALKINPWLKNWLLGGAITFFTCKNFDSEKNLCKIHETRPSVCREYPHYRLFDGYSRLSVEDPLYDPNCGYKLDQERFKLIKLLKQRINFEKPIGMVKAKELKANKDE